MLSPIPDRCGRHLRPVVCLDTKRRSLVRGLQKRGWSSAQPADHTAWSTSGCSRAC